MSPFRTIFFVLFLFVASWQPLIGQQPQQPNTENYYQGITLFEKGLYERSAEELEDFVAEFPAHPLAASASFYKIRSLSKVNPTQKREYYERFIQSRPNSVFAQKLLFELAEIAKKTGNYQRALSYYRQALRYNISNRQAARVYYWMAETAVQIGEAAKAREYFATLAGEYPQSEWAPKALYARGRLFLDDGSFEAASATFEELQERYPNKDITRRIGTALGESYYQQGRYNEALQALQAGLPYLEGGQKKKAILLIGESYNALGELDEASSTYLRYINLTEGTEQERAAHYGLGWVYHKQEIYHWAADEFALAAEGQDKIARKALYYKAVNEKLGGNYQQAIETFRTFGDRFKEGLWIEEAYYEWAITAYELGEYGESIQALLYLVRSDEELRWEGKIYTLLGQSYFANKEYTRALQAYDHAEQMADIPPEVKRQARYQKAWLLFLNQAYEEAQAIFENLYQQGEDTDITSKALFWSADSYFNQQQFGPAATEFRQFIQNNPNHKLTGAAYYSLGWSYFKMGEYRQAIDPFQRFLNDYEAPEIALFPYDIDTRLRLGDSYFAISNYEQAIQTYQQAAGDDPGGDYALFQIANSYYRAEQTYQAVSTFRRLLSTYPNSGLSEQAQYNIAYIYLNSGNYEQSIEEFQTVIENYDGTTWAALSQYNIGDAYYNAGEYENAAEAYQKVLQNYPNSDYVVEAANAIEYAQQAAGRVGSPDADTVSVLDTFIQNNPNAANARRLRFRQAEELMQTGDYINAIEAFEEFINTSDNQDLLPEAYSNLAIAYEQTNRSSNAIETYQTIIQEFTDSEEASEALIALGQMEYTNGNYQSAIDYYNRVIANGGSKLSAAHVGWGDALLALNEIEAAKEQYNSALNVKGSNAAAEIGIARAALQQENYSAATQRLTTVASSNTGQEGAQAQYLLGAAQQEQGNFNEAIEEFSKVRVLYEFYGNWVAKSIMGSAEAYIQLGNQGRARNMLQELIDQYPASTEAQRAGEMLD